MIPENPHYPQGLLFTSISPDPGLQDLHADLTLVKQLHVSVHQASVSVRTLSGANDNSSACQVKQNKDLLDLPLPSGMAGSRGTINDVTKLPTLFSLLDSVYLCAGFTLWQAFVWQQDVRWPWAHIPPAVQPEK